MMRRGAAWSECSENTILGSDIRFHCIDRFACLLNYLSFVRVCYN